MWYRRATNCSNGIECELEWLEVECGKCISELEGIPCEVHSGGVCGRRHD